MAELNRDLGYDFGADFLGALGSEWAFGILPFEKDAGLDWVLVGGVRDAATFIERAGRLAAISGEPWSELAAEDGMRRFATRALTVHLHVAVGDGVVLAAPSEQAMTRALKLERGPGEKAPTAPWSIRLQATLPGLGRMLPQNADTEFARHGLSQLPLDARVTVDLRRLPEALSAYIRIQGVTPADLPKAIAPKAGPRNE